MEFDNLDSRPGKSWNFGPGHGKSWNLMLANNAVLDCPKCVRENTLDYRRGYPSGDRSTNFCRKSSGISAAHAQIRFRQP